MNRCMMAVAGSLLLGIGLLSGAAQAGGYAGELAAGRRSLVEERPAAALAHFQTALGVAGDNDERRAALIGIGHAALWLDRYRLAERAYREALDLARTEEDRQVIATKLAKALNMLDRPREAYALAAPLSGESPEAAVEAARAALLLGWEQRAVAAFGKYDRQAGTRPAPGWLEREYARQRTTLEERLWPLRIDFDYSEDTDDLRMRALRANAVFHTPALEDMATGKAGRLVFWGVGVNREWLDDPRSAAQLTEVSGSFLTNLGDNARLSARLGGGEHDDWDYFIGNLALSYRPQDRWGLEAGYEASPVKTIAALGAEIDYETLSLGADYRLSDLLVAAGMGYRQRFSDGNDRAGGVLRLTLVPQALPNTPAAVGAQLYARSFRNDAPGAAGYFNPRDFEEAQIRILLNHRFTPSLVGRAMFGAGEQRVDGDASTSGVGEIQLDQLIDRRARLLLKAGVGDTAVFTRTGSGYRQTYVNASVLIPW